MGFVLILLATTLGSGTVPSQPTSQPLVQRHFADELSCQQAATASTHALGTRLVCISAETETALHAAY